MIFRKITISCGLSAFLKQATTFKRKNKTHLKCPAILLPTGTHSELQGWLPTLLPGKNGTEEDITGVGLQETQQELPHPVGRSPAAKKGLEAGEATKTGSGKGWGH